MRRRGPGSLARSMLERPLFELPTRLRDGLKRGCVDADLRRAFAARDHGLGAACRVDALGPAKWLLVDENGQIVIRDRRTGLSVARRRFPRLIRLIEGARHLVKAGPRRLRQYGFCRVAILRKRVLEHPRQLMVNLGAGRWHVRGWKVLDHSEGWYRYPRFYLDFPHDMTDGRPLPFADGTVHRFYSEHVFEHFPDAVCARVFRDMHRCLAATGGARIVVPDAELIWRRFGERDERFFRRWMRIHNASLTEALLILVGHPRQRFDEDDVARRHAALPRGAFLDQCTAGLAYDPRRAGEHVNWFDFDKLARMFGEAGFRRIELSEGQASRFPEMRGRGFDRRAWYSLHVDLWP